MTLEIYFLDITPSTLRSYSKLSKRLDMMSTPGMNGMLDSILSESIFLLYYLFLMSVSKCPSVYYIRLQTLHELPRVFDSAFA